MKLALVQYDPSWEIKEENKQKLSLILQNLSNKPDIIIFPEMTLTGFTMKPADFAEEVNGSSFDFFADVAVRNSCEVMAGLIEKDKNVFFNSLLHIGSKGNLIKAYRKIHPFSCSGEDKYYSAGTDKIITEAGNYKIGLSICYDLRFPELYRFYGKEKVHLIVNIANWPVPRIEHYRTLLKARAIENQCYVAGVNRIGADPTARYNGFSSVFDPMGKELVSTENEEKIIIADIDEEYVNHIRTQLPFLEDIKLI